jgi:hypothetical protein
MPTTLCHLIDRDGRDAGCYRIPGEPPVYVQKAAAVFALQRYGPDEAAAETRAVYREVAFRQLRAEEQVWPDSGVGGQASGVGNPLPARGERAG